MPVSKEPDMNPIPTLRFCIRLGSAAFALLAPDIALVVLPALGLLSRTPARTLSA
jgi:hypothetical protein